MILVALIEYSSLPAPKIAIDFQSYGLSSLLRHHDLLVQRACAGHTRCKALVTSYADRTVFSVTSC